MAGKDNTNSNFSWRTERQCQAVTHFAILRIDVGTNHQAQAGEQRENHTDSHKRLPSPPNYNSPLAHHELPGLLLYHINMQIVIRQQALTCSISSKRFSTPSQTKSYKHYRNPHQKGLLQWYFINSPIQSQTFCGRVGFSEGQSQNKSETHIYKHCWCFINIAVSCKVDSASSSEILSFLTSVPVLEPINPSPPGKATLNTVNLADRVGVGAGGELQKAHTGLQENIKSSISLVPSAGYSCILCLWTQQEMPAVHHTAPKVVLLRSKGFQCKKKKKKRQWILEGLSGMQVTRHSARRSITWDWPSSYFLPIVIIQWTYLDNASAVPDLGRNNLVQLQYVHTTVGILGHENPFAALLLPTHICCLPRPALDAVLHNTFGREC